MSKHVWQQNPDGTRTCLTTIQRDARKIVTLRGTKFKIAIPADWSSVQTVFTIGNVRFNLYRQGFVEAIDPIPASWFVDISEGVEEYQEELEIA
jgi:hypothetical protein